MGKKGKSNDFHSKQRNEKEGIIKKTSVNLYMWEFNQNDSNR
jgi:hypothetical protein